MQPVEIALRLLAGVALILANGFFVAIEFALTRARQFTESEFVGDGNPALERAWAMTDDLEIYLTSCWVPSTSPNCSGRRRTPRARVTCWPTSTSKPSRPRR